MIFQKSFDFFVESELKKEVKNCRGFYSKETRERITISVGIELGPTWDRYDSWTTLIRNGNTEEFWFLHLATTSIDEKSEKA